MIFHAYYRGHLIKEIVGYMNDGTSQFVTIQLLRGNHGIVTVPMQEVVIA